MENVGYRKSCYIAEKVMVVLIYQSLNKIFYKDESNYLCEYKKRFSSAFTKHFDIEIKQFNHKNAYPAFLCYTEEMVCLLEKIYLANQELLALLPAVPNVIIKQFYLLCVIDEVKASNDIEGNHSTRRELREAMEDIDDKNRFVSTMKKYKMMKPGLKMDFSTPEALRKFYDDFAHKEVVIDNPRNALDGKLFRRDSVDVDSGTGRTVHRGVYPEKKIIEYLKRALDIFNGDNMPVLVRMAVFHYIFAYIHPFYDGNGRTARFMASYAMLEHIHPMACLRLSTSINKNKAKYYKMFANTDAEINRGDLTPFVLEFLEFVLQSIIDTKRLLSRKLTQYNENTHILDKITNDELTLKIYILLFQASVLYGQGITVSKLESELKKSRNTIMDRLKKIPPEYLFIHTVKKVKYYKLNLLILKNNREKVEG